MKSEDKKAYKLVYSSECGTVCPNCSNPLKMCKCRGQGKTPPNDGIVRVSRETKGHKGKGITVVTGIDLNITDLRKLAKALKQKCGSGDTVKSGAIEIQGDHRALLISELKRKGYLVKGSGG